MLRKLGYEILVASHGKECLEILEREASRGRDHEIEVILMDGMQSTRISNVGGMWIDESRVPIAHSLSAGDLCFCFAASMDIMDGLECTRVIRSQQLPHRTTPYIIAQTANVSSEFRSQCLGCGMSVSNAHTHTRSPCLVWLGVACGRSARSLPESLLMCVSCATLLC